MLKCVVTFGGMWRWRRVAVARVFALVVRCRVMLLLLYSRVGKNRDTKRESPAGAGAGRTADHIAFLFSQKVLAVRKANDIYRPVRFRAYSPLVFSTKQLTAVHYNSLKALHALATPFF
jgi:hypothetical protein